MAVSSMQLEMEYRQLSQKIAELECILASPNTRGNSEDFTLMHSQLEGMRQYSTALLNRIKLIKED